MRFYIADDVIDYKDAWLMKDSSEHPIACVQTSPLPQEKLGE